MSAAKASRRPERIVHIGVGAFFRAHQAWYTNQVDHTQEWGIVGYTGRSAMVADELRPQDCKYSLITRSATGDHIDIIESLVRVEDGANVADLVATVANPLTALVTLTITEAGYRVKPDLTLDTADSEVAWDLQVLSEAVVASPVTAMGRLALALDARRKAGAGPIAIVSCDNMPDNGKVVRQALEGFAAVMGVQTVAYFQNQVSYVTTSIDRITPKTTDADKALVVAQTGWADNSPVVTEPFRDWVLSGEFPAGRPAWEEAGARFVDEIEPWENRKLWLLNGSHSLLAYAGQLAGYETVSDAIADAGLLEAVEKFWDEACEQLPTQGLDLPAYRAALLERFRNPRIRHNLAQIANEGATKLRVRVAPAALAQLKKGKSGEASAFAIAAWVKWISQTDNYIDARGADIELAKKASDSVTALVTLVSPQLAENAAFLDRIRALQ
jgi:fructuronate reductase